MEGQLINIGLGFVEGLALIVSPCILPILPIILSGSLTGQRSRPLGIIIGFIFTFTLVTLFSRSLIESLDINPESLRYTSFALLILLGVMMMSTYLSEQFNLLTQALTRIGVQNKKLSRQDFWGGILFGCLVGIIWTPCAGPILAAVIVQVIIQTTTLSSILTVIAFGIGAGVPMFLIAFFGRGLIEALPFLRTHTVLIRKILGCTIILAVVYFIYTGGTGILPSERKENEALNAKGPARLIEGLERPFPAPEIANIDAWINSPPLTLNALKGKVVLIDFWTYSCINCIRTFPYLKEWYAKYHQQGLVIIGIHSPEFQFEHRLENVENAVKKYGILYPVALDNHFTTWQNFYNAYWPAHYLINKEGQVVYIHFGEGKYDVTENNIRYLLGLKKMAFTPEKKSAPSDISLQTPETYLGYARSDLYQSPEREMHDTIGKYSYPTTLSKNAWALSGKWIVNADKIVSAEKNASIKIHFYATKVYAVIGASQDATATIKVLLNGELYQGDANSDVKNGIVSVKQNQLYRLIQLPEGKEGTLELIVEDANVEFYTFTFG